MTNKEINEGILKASIGLHRVALLVQQAELKAQAELIARREYRRQIDEVVYQKECDELCPF